MRKEFLVYLLANFPKVNQPSKTRNSMIQLIGEILENNLMIPVHTDGIIKDILVKKGIQVDSDDLLVLMETTG